MPTYEYICNNCGISFEKFQNMSDKPIKKCPECNGKVQRQFGAGAGVIFKGSGFYATDYHKSSAIPCGRSKTCCGRDTSCGKN